MFPFLSCPNSGFIWILPVVEGSFHLWFGWLSNSYSYSNYCFLGFSHHLPPVMGAFVVWVIGLVSSSNYFLCYTGKQWVSFGEIVYSLYFPSDFLLFVICSLSFLPLVFLLCFWLPLGNCLGDWLLHSCCCFCLTIFSSICFVLKSLLKYISSLNLQMLSYRLRSRLMRIGEQSGISSALIPINILFFFCNFFFLGQDVYALPIYLLIFVWSSYKELISTCIKVHL